MVPLSNVLAIHQPSPYTDALKRVARMARVSLFVIPDRMITGGYDTSPACEIIASFLRANHPRSYLFSINIVPDIFISDDTVYIGKTHAIDKEGMVQKFLEKKIKWLLVKDDETTDDVLLKTVNKHVQKEKGLLSCGLVSSPIGFKNLLAFLQSLESTERDRKEVP